MAEKPAGTFSFDELPNTGHQETSQAMGLSGMDLEGFSMGFGKFLEVVGGFWRFLEEWV